MRRGSIKAPQKDLEDFSLYNEGVTLNLKPLEAFVKMTFGRNLRLKKIKPKVVTEGLVLNTPKTNLLFQTVSRNQKACNIILTHRLIATFDENKKPHIRSSVFGYPSIISIAGIVEGPAKPKEYYLKKQRYASLGLWPLKESELKQEFKKRFLDYGDKRLTSVLKGLISQAIFFHFIGDPFCSKKSCRLYNSHWQEDLIRTQLEQGKFCKKHKTAVNSLKKYLTAR